MLDRAAIDADLRRRQQGYGRSPRQQIETDEVEVLAGLRHGRTLGTPLALVVRNRDHKNWTWGMNPWPPDGEPQGKGTKPVTLPRPGHADLAGVAEVRARRRARRARAGERAAHGGHRRRGRGREGAAREYRDRGRTAPRTTRRISSGGSTPRAPSETPPAASSRYARAGCRPGSARTRRATTRLDARLAARADGDPGGEGRRDRRGLRARGRARLEAHDEIVPGYVRGTNRAGGIEAGVSNGEEIVVRAAMKPLPTLMKPLRSVDLKTGEPGEALVERSDVAAVEALAVVAEASVAFELARAAREKFGGDALGDFVGAWRAYLERIPWARTR